MNLEEDSSRRITEGYRISLMESRIPARQIEKLVEKNIIQTDK